MLDISSDGKVALCANTVKLSPGSVLLNGSISLAGCPTVTANTSYTTAMIRNIVTTETDPGEGASSTLNNGTIIFVK